MTVEAVEARVLRGETIEFIAIAIRIVLIMHNHLIIKQIRNLLYISRHHVRLGYVQKLHVCHKPGVPRCLRRNCPVFNENRKVGARSKYYVHS